MAATPTLTPPAGEPVVCLDGLVKRYGRRLAVDGVSLRLARGELYGLIGADGSGKSSLFKAVAGVLSVEGGTLQVLGHVISSERDAEQVRQRIGFMPQGLGLNLYPELSVDENIDFFADLRGVPPALRDQRKARLLAVTRLGAFRIRPMKQLSGGMKQKLGLVCTLIHEPELLLLDEPTTGVDPLSRRDFWQLLPALLRERGMSALVATAYIDEAGHFDRVGLMHGGALLAQGDPARLPDQLAATVVVATGAGTPALHRLAHAFGAVDRHGDGASVLVPTRDGEAALAQVRAVLGAVPLCDVSVRLLARPPTLEDLVIAHLRGCAVPGSTATQAGAAAIAGIGQEKVTWPADSGPLPPGPACTARLGAGPVKAVQAVEAVGLTRDFGGFCAVDGVSFRVAHGEIVGLLGANGAGKTTVIKMLTGILPPTAGMGQVAGADMRRASRQIRQRIGYMSQAFSLYADLSVRDNLMLYAGIYGLAGRGARERAAWVVGLGGLQAHLDDTAASLPMGLRQRLALGCALLHRPGVLVLDEPTSGVDPLGRRHFWNILSWLAREEGVAILLSTHHMAEADLCDRLVLLFDGRVVADASPAALKQRLRVTAGELLELQCDAPARAAALLRDAGHLDAALHGHAVRLMAADGAAAEPRLAGLLAANGVVLRGVSACDIGMDEVFVHQIGALQARAA